MDFVIKDSGNRQSFSNGSVRDTREGKGRYDLIPCEMLERLAKHYEAGSKKYGDNNWQLGQPLSRYYDSAFRHLLSWQKGLKDEDHLTAAIWNLTAIIHHEMNFGRDALILDMGPNKVND